MMSDREETNNTVTSHRRKRETKIVKSEPAEPKIKIKQEEEEDTTNTSPELFRCASSLRATPYPISPKIEDETKAEEEPHTEPRLKLEPFESARIPSPKPSSSSTSPSPSPSPSWSSGTISTLSFPSSPSDASSTDGRSTRNDDDASASSERNNRRKRMMMMDSRSESTAIQIPRAVRNTKRPPPTTTTMTTMTTMTRAIERRKQDADTQTTENPEEFYAPLPLPIPNAAPTVRFGTPDTEDSAGGMSSGSAAGLGFGLGDLTQTSYDHIARQAFRFPLRRSDAAFDDDHPMSDASSWSSAGPSGNSLRRTDDTSMSDDDDDEIRGFDARNDAPNHDHDLDHDSESETDPDSTITTTYISSGPLPRWSTLALPRSRHPFLDGREEQNIPCPIPHMLGIPLFIHRAIPASDSSDPFRLAHSTDPKYWQPATHLLSDPRTGFEPPRWQMYLGNVVVLRGDERPFGEKSFQAVWFFVGQVSRMFAEGEEGVVEGMCTAEGFRGWFEEHRRYMMMIVEEGREREEWEAMICPCDV